jgi:hypothetical protein
LQLRRAPEAIVHGARRRTIAGKLRQVFTNRDRVEQFEAKRIDELVNRGASPAVRWVDFVATTAGTSP